MPPRDHAILDRVPAHLLRFGPDRRFLYVNRAMADHIGRPPEEVVGRSLVDLGVAPELADHVWAVVEGVFATAVPVEFEHRGVFGIGGRWLLTRVIPEPDAAGVVRTALGITTDITNLKLVEDALREREGRFRAIFDSTFQYIGLLDPAGTLLEANRVALVSAGVSLEDVVGRPFWEAVWWCHNPVLQGQLRQAIRRAADGEFVRFEATHPLADGTLAVIDFSISPIRDASGRVVLLVPEGRDITSLKRAEGALRESEGRFRAFMRHAPAVMWIKDPDGRFQAVSHRMGELFGGAERWLGKTDHEVLPREVADLTAGHDRQVRETGVPMQVVEDVPTADGQMRPWLVAKFPIPQADGRVSTGGLALDLTEQRKAEEDRRKAEQRLYESLRLESLGVLAGGIAHDFNNLLTSVLGYASLANMDVAAGRGAALPGYLANIETAAARAADLCKQMLAYSGKGQFLVQAVGLNRLVEEMAQLLQASINKKAVLRLALAAEQPVVSCDATQIRQVVLNLITNASDAIGERGGVISVATGVIDAAADHLTDLKAGHLAPGRYAYLQVTDTGCGMSADTLTRIFEPFYTTKAMRRGLGLSAIQGIVRGHQGAIRVDSEFGRGSTFQVLLPTREAAAVSAAADHGPVRPDGRGRLVLVIDDEEDVREFVQTLLGRYGFTVALAPDGRAGEAEYRSRQAEVELVLCDLTMPRQDGLTTFRHLRQLDPAVRVILMSGFAASESTARLNVKGLQGFLRKPFRTEELLDAVFAAVGV